MAKLDQFESAFRAADKPVYAYKQRAVQHLAGVLVERQAFDEASGDILLPHSSVTSRTPRGRGCPLKTVISLSRCAEPLMEP